MGLPSQRSDDDSALVDEIIRSIDGADDPKRIRSLLNAWWRYAGVRAAAGAEVDAEKFLAERSSLGLLELPVATARAVIELEYAIANGPQGPLPVVVAPELTPPERPIAVAPAPEPEPELEAEPVAEVELEEIEPELDEPDEAEPVAEVELEEIEPELDEPEPLAEVAPEPEAGPEPEPEVAIVAEAEPEAEPEAPSYDAEIEAALEAAASETQLEAELDWEADATAEPAPEPEFDAAPAPVGADPRDRFEDAEPIPPLLALVPEAQLEPEFEPAPEPDFDLDAEPYEVPDPAPAPIPVASLMRTYEEVDPPASWEALEKPVPITHFERFRRDRADRGTQSVDHAKYGVYAGLIVFFSLAIGIAMAASLVVTHIPLPVPGAETASVVEPWRAWLAIVAGVAGVAVATVIARRHDMHQVLFGPRIGLGGLALTGIGLLAGSVIAAVAGGVVLLGGAALGAVRRA
jgi:hypothetical protein